MFRPDLSSYCGLFLPFICTQRNFLEMKMLNDEIVDEVRAIRDAHAAIFGYNLRAIYADLKQSEAAHIATGHPFVLSPPETSVSCSTLQQTRFGYHRLS
ncbi:MAG: hypothetical protein Q8O31_06140 [Rhodocyclaceae bacterium]|nr:hypothetical protein [Rhodocyclaceae bacterium]